MLAVDRLRTCARRGMCLVELCAKSRLSTIFVQGVLLFETSHMRLAFKIALRHQINSSTLKTQTIRGMVHVHEKNTFQSNKNTETTLLY